MAVIAQPLVTALVPAAERFDIGDLRADSYIPIVVNAVLCFGVGVSGGGRVGAVNCPFCRLDDGWFEAG